MISRPKLSQRLLCAASFVRDGSFIADIGTDHAYIPIDLMMRGKIRGAVASDINKGPLERASANLHRFGISEGITLNLSNGLEGIEQFCPDDILILGMGGELITEILASAPFTKNNKIRLILQPMTHPEKIREFLSKNMFGIVHEEIVIEDKIYQIIVASFCGKSEDLTPIELICGKQNIARLDKKLLALLSHHRSVLEARRSARSASESNYENEEESALLSEINDLINKIEKGNGSNDC